MIEAMLDLLSKARDSGASDLHITVGTCPKMRLRGELTNIENYPVMTPDETKSILYSILTEFQISYLENMGELDFAYEDETGTRYRANIYKQKGCMGGVFRVLPSKILTIDDLGLPPVARHFAQLKKGLVLVTGPTGSGKSTTLAAIVNQINRTRREHIITIEDPIEYVHDHQLCIVNQREVGTDTLSFENALRGSLREDPDVILVGEMRDNETISVALTAAETGHLVFSTLHTIGAASTINRVIDSFPPHARQQVRTQLAMVLEGVVTQRLVPTKDGKGRMAALEVLVVNDAIRNMIREDKTHQISSTMQTSTSAGMQTLDFHLATLVKEGKITQKTALSNCIDVDSFKRYMMS
jgi:twitching motility protein PilT